VHGAGIDSTQCAKAVFAVKWRTRSARRCASRPVYRHGVFLVDYFFFFFHPTMHAISAMISQCCAVKRAQMRVPESDVLMIKASVGTQLTIIVTSGVSSY